MPGTGKYHITGGTGAAISQLKHKMKWSKAASNESSILEVESWLLICAKESGHTRSLLGNEEAFVFFHFFYLFS